MAYSRFIGPSRDQPSYLITKSGVGSLNRRVVNVELELISTLELPAVKSAKDCGSGIRLRDHFWQWA